MATDNRTLLNDCSATTGWTGSDAVTLNSDAGQSYEGGSSLSTQLSNADEQMSTTSIGGTRNLAASTVYMLAKDNLGESFANGGVQLVLGDGTDLIGYDVGGYDRKGLNLPFFFNAYKLDVSVRVTTPGTNFAVYAGSEAALDQTAITVVGYGSLHLAKAAGAIDNVYMDAFRFALNSAYHLTVNAGTVGTPIDFASVVTSDISGGWGMIGNPQGKQYDLFASTEFGTPSGTADSYFEATSFQLYLLGIGMAAGNFILRTIGNATGTNSFVLSSGVIVNIDTRAVFDMSDDNMDIFELTSVTFTDLGALTMPNAGGTSRFANACIFNTIDQSSFGTLPMAGATFNGSNDVNGCMIIGNESVTNKTGFIFNADGGHAAIEIAPTQTSPDTVEYTFNGWIFNGFTSSPESGAALFINPTDLTTNITINVVGGGSTPSYRVAASYSGTVTINNNVSVTLTDLEPNTEVRVYLAEDFNSPIDVNQLAGIEDIASPTEFTFSASAGTVVDIVVFNVNFLLPPNNRIKNFTVPTSDTSFPITQIPDRNFNNP